MYAYSPSFLKLKVPVIFLGTVGFSRPREGTLVFIPSTSPLPPAPHRAGCLSSAQMLAKSRISNATIPVFYYQNDPESQPRATQPPELFIRLIFRTQSIEIESKQVSAILVKQGNS